MRSARILVGLVLFAVFFAGCVLPGQARTDAIAVWQHQGNSWDIYYSIWNHDAKAWFVPGGGVSAPIAVDEGDDHDPDVSSNDKKAIAVWAKSGSGIYYSVWENMQWSSVASLSDGTDSDPTVAVDPKGNALAVWVRNKNSLYYSYYKTGIGWTTVQKVDTSGLNRVSLPELTYSTPEGLYYLVFTGTDAAGNNNAYVSAYGTSVGWSAPMYQSSSALLDNNMPTDQRTGASAAEGTKEATFVWPAPNNDLYSVKLGSSPKNYADGEMPDVSYDSSEKANGAYTDADDLFHQPNVNSPTTKLTISGLKESDDRASLTFIRDRTVGLVVWWTEVNPPGQIYYSYYENGQWLGVGQIDPSLSRELDRNPAVTPLRALTPEEPPEEGYCGDKVLQAPEQCEVGIACPNPKDTCFVPPCVCRQQVPPPPNETLDCSMNTFPKLFGFSLFRPGMICKDDCKAAYGNDWTCDPVACECNKKPQPPPTNISCAVNSVGVAFGAINTFGPGMICKDDCKQLDPELTCNAKTCVCEKTGVPPKPRNVSCTFNAFNDVVGGPAFGPNEICLDDCETYLGDEWECDMISCVCEEEEDPVRKCADHTKEVDRTDVNDFNASTMKCEDNCQELGSDYECNIGSCTCTKKRKEEVSCGSNTIADTLSSVVAVNSTPFNAATMQCKDDCKEYFGIENVICDAEKCTCEPATYCADNTDDTIYYRENYAYGQCIDNCKELGEGYKCDAEACVCRRDEGMNVYCAANTDDAFLRGVEGKSPPTFDSTVHQCIDNCQKLGNYKCNMESCYCEPQDLGRSCSLNTQYVDATDKNPFTSAMQCLDDCEEDWGEDYECNVESCTCVKKVEKYSCLAGLSNMFSFDIFGDAFDASSDICVDDCKDGGKLYGDVSLKCNAESCMCLPSTPCASNTLSTVQGSGTNTFTSTVSLVPQMCEDNCQSLGPGWYCDTEPCLCRRETSVSEVYCAANTGEAYVTHAVGVASAAFNPSTMQCRDNCKQNMGPDSKCDMQKCVCVPDDGQTVSCAVNTGHSTITRANGFNSGTMQCSDDCSRQLGSGYYCDAESCTCSTSRPPTEISCVDNSGVNRPLGLDQSYPNGWQCKDDCSELTGGPWKCNAQKCECELVIDEMPCSGQGLETTTAGIAPGWTCKDDCAATLGSEYQCNIEACMCYQATTPEISCADNSGEAAVGALPQSYICLDNCMEKLGMDYYCDQGTCQCYPRQAAVCGDGVISYGEDCDYGSANTNTCIPDGEFAYPYCTESCTCKELETSPRCGDGKITYGEDCDGGNVKTAICSEGYKCYTPECKCIPLEGSGQCGDGTVTAPEECDHGNTYTAECPGSLICSSCQCVEWGQTSHKECDYEIGECVSVIGPGEDSCFSDSQCQTPTECGNGEREGSEECDGNDDDACSINEFCNNYCQCQSIPVACGDGKLDAGEECEDDDQCNQEMGEICYNCNCLAPPSVNCNSWCADQGYSEALQGTFGSAEACSAAASESEQNCYVKCIYIGFGSWSNQAGTTTCCCKEKYMQQCTMLPSGGCECPDEITVDTEICPSHAP